MSLHVRGVEYHGGREVAVPAGDAFGNLRQHTAFAPTTEAPPDAVVFSEPAGKLLAPHCSGAERPPDSVESAIDALVRATATAANLFPINGGNFLCSSLVFEGISSALYPDIEYCHSCLDGVASQHLKSGQRFVHAA